MIVTEKEKRLQDLAGTSQGVGRVIDAFKSLQEYWSKRLGTDSVYFFHVKKDRPAADADTVVKQAADFLLSFADQVASTPDSSTLVSIIPTIEAYRAEAQKSMVVAQTLIDKNDPAWFRRQAIHDDPYERGGIGYGNGNTYPDDPHGTQCAGIIGAHRSPVSSREASPAGLGDNTPVRGIANDVLIMPIRINAMGHLCDEWDKDVANAIRYAVDNGAQVVSMSFGKYISPQHAWVAEAIAYAEKKGVLLVHAAMNDGVDLDSTAGYPSATIDGGRRANNFITVGASGFDSSLVGDFSNYGRHTVDVFAPGVSIEMTNLGGHHERGLGTSYACPMVSGVAAMIWSYYPQLSVQQLKQCIEQSATPVNVMVTKPHTNEKVAFSSLSRTGGIVNAYQAIRLAQRIAGHH
jgi:subtilisin family serine protease